VSGHPRDDKSQEIERSTKVGWPDSLSIKILAKDSRKDQTSHEPPLKYKAL